jgi:hypothetical protein
MSGHHIDVSQLVRQPGEQHLGRILVLRQPNAQLAHHVDLVKVLRAVLQCHWVEGSRLRRLNRQELLYVRLDVLDLVFGRFPERLKAGWGFTELLGGANADRTEMRVEKIFQTLRAWVSRVLWLLGGNFLLTCNLLR